jgi:hypothetical protein
MNSEEKSDINVLFQTPEDILKEKKMELVQEEKDKEKKAVQKDILGLLQKNFEILDSRKRFREVVEEDLKRMIEEGDEDLTAICKIKLYEIISASESNTFASVSKLFSDLTKSNTIGLSVNDKELGDISREDIQNVSAVLKFINKVKDVNKKEDTPIEEE